ncbi:MAG: LbtU family siderophore porin [Candidatus Thiodiazotropha endolucinida]
MPQHARRLFAWLIGLCLILLVSSPAAADETVEEALETGQTTGEDEPTEKQRIYRTREEQREAGLQTAITPWLTLSGLLEGEIQTDRYVPRNREDVVKSRDDNANIQIGLVIDLFGLAEAEVVAEYDSDPDKFSSEEAFVTFESDPMELSLGKQFTPLGLYFDHFITGPMLEFGETSARHVILLAYGPSDQFDLTLAAYRGRSSKVGADDAWDWAVGFEAWPTDTFSFGLSYQSDLSDSDERILDDDHYIERVPAVSGYLFGMTDAFEFSLEVVAALEDFRELEKDLNRPIAWNAEVAYFFPNFDAELALRIENSHELEDEPEHRYGAAITWYLHKRANLTLEILRAQFDAESYAIDLDDDEVSIQHANTMSAKISIVF